MALHRAVDNFSDWPGFIDLLGRVWRQGTSVEGARFDVAADREAVHYRSCGTAKIDMLATVRANKIGGAVLVMIKK